MLRYHARWLAPVSSPPIEHGTVAVDGGRIAYVGPRDAAPPGRDEELGDSIVVPGLVDAHARLGPDDADSALAAGLRAGVTTGGASGSADESLRAMSALGVRGIVYVEVVGPHPAEHDAALATLAARVARLRPLETDRVRLGVAPCGVHAVHEDLLVDACAWAVGERLPIAIPVAESDDEIAFLREAEGPFARELRARGVDVVRRSYSPVHLLKELGIADVATPLLVHCVKLGDSDVSFVAAAGCRVAHCPSSNERRGRGVAPLVELLDAGVAVGLGTDSGAAGDRDVLGEARLAARLQARRLGRPDAVSPADALRLATFGGARALGLDASVGSLEVGKEADLAAFPLDGADQRDDPVASLLRDLAGVPPALVVVAGRVRVRGGRLLAPSR